MIRSWLLISLILLVHLVLLLNTRFTLWPEMVVYPYLVNKGFFLYKEIINPYPPILTFFLTIFAKIVGYHPVPYQILTWIFILTIDLSIFYIAKKIFKKLHSALASLLFFMILSIPFGVNGLWFDLVQTSFILFATYYFYQYLQKPKQIDTLLLSFFLLTIAFFIKQQAIWLILWFTIVLFLKFRTRIFDIFLKNFYLFAPFIFLFLIQILTFWQKGTLFDFIYWTIYFPFFKASTMPGYILLPTLRQILPIAALFLLFTPAFFKTKFETNFLISTAFVSLFFAYPRFDYFHLIPSLALISVMFGENLKNLSTSNFPARIVFVFSLFFLVFFTGRYLTRNWHQDVRFFEKDVMQAAAFLAKITSSSEPIYIQNGPDQILPLANRLPVKPWADEFPWYLETKNVQTKILAGIIAQDPKFVIFKPYDTGPKYELGVYRPQKLADYLDEKYQNLTQISDTLWLKTKK